MLHLDIKPSNILLRNDTPVLIDFGATKIYDILGMQCTRSPIVNSYEYAPPEYNDPKSLIKFSPQTDIFLLGKTLQYLISGTTSNDSLNSDNFSIGILDLLKNCYLEPGKRIYDIGTFMSFLKLAGPYMRD